MEYTNLSKSYSEPSPVYAKMSPRLQRMKDVYGGNETMREAGEVYLRMLTVDTAESYRARLNALAIENSVRDAVEGYVGRIFSKPTTLGKDWEAHAEAKKWWEDIDRKGNNGDSFFRRVVSMGIRDGISWVFVDMPLNNAQTLYEERQSGIRPYCTFYSATDVIFVLADDQGRITDFRVKEEVTSVDGNGRMDTETRYRRYTPGLCQVYQEDGTMLAEITMSFSPERGVSVVPYITDPEPGADFYVKPPLMDMADLQIRLWQSTGEQQNCLSIARCPFLFGTGLQIGKEKVEIGAEILFHSEQTDASLRWVEISGGSLSAGDKDIENIQKAIEAEGLKPLISSSGNRTATEVSTDEARAISPLRKMADDAKDMIENVLRFMDIWVNGETSNTDGWSITLNSNFDIALAESATLAELRFAVTNQMITKQTYLAELKRRDIVSDDVDINAELEALAAAGHGEDI